MAPKPVDLYLRVSRVGGREHLISPDEQERRARALAAERGLIVGDVLTDLDESGGKWDRPGLQLALERVRDGRSGGLIVAWLDRLSRDSEHAHRLVREITENGGKVYAPDAPADWTSPEGELQAGIVFAFAQYVRSRSKASFERSKEQAVARGIPVSTRAPVGYRKRDDRRLEPDPETAPVVRQVFELRAQGAGPTELAGVLESAGVRTSAGSATWSLPAVKQLIANRVYLGELAYGLDRRYVNPDAHDPIVDLATWAAAQHPNGTRPRTVRGGDYLLNGILRCASCGYMMSPTRTSKDRGAKRAYRCRRRHASGICPGPAYNLADALELEAAQVFREILGAALEMRHPDGSLISRGEPPPALDALEETLALAERRLEQALAPEVQDAAGEGWAPMVRERRDARDAAALELGRQRAEQGTDDLVVTVEQVLTGFDRASVETRRELLAKYLPVLALTPARLLFVFPKGSELPEVRQRGRRAEVAPMTPIAANSDTIVCDLS